MKQITLVLAINAWAFVLDIVWLLCLVGVILCFNFGLSLWFALIFAIVGLYPFMQAVILHSQTREKLAAYRLLLARNQNEFREDTFETFMAAPCGRMIVRCVLQSLSCPERFAMLKEKYGNAFFKCDKPGLVIVPVKQENINTGSVEKDENS